MKNGIFTLEKFPNFNKINQYLTLYLEKYDMYLVFQDLPSKNALKTLKTFYNLRFCRQSKFKVFLGCPGTYAAGCSQMQTIPSFALAINNVVTQAMFILMAKWSKIVKTLNLFSLHPAWALVFTESHALTTLCLT